MLRCAFYILILYSFALISCKESNPAPHMMEPVVPNPVAPQKYSFLALGDSYTIGESVPEEERWGVHLASLLRAGGVAVSNPTTIARTGWTTSELSQAIAARQITQTFDLVSLLIGVNNQYRGQSLESYRTELAELIKTSIRFAKNEPGRVILLSIPDWGQTPFAQGQDAQRITQEINVFNAVAQEEAKKAGVTFIDINPLTKKAATDRSYVASDGLHYSGKMHLEWAQLALPIGEKILK